MTKVSIIIPVYNVSQYLRRCLDSCVYQTLEDIEIVVVNDCSPDMRDTVIMKEYETKYPGKIMCIWHNENKKNGGARNTGIRAAHGEYILCVDADDCIDINMCSELYDSIIINGSDMAVCDYYLLQNGQVTEVKINVDISEHPFGISTVCWVVMIKKALINDYELFFPEYILTEDNITFLWYMAATKISKVDKCFYFYYRRKGSSVVGNDFEMPFFTLVDLLNVVCDIKKYSFWEELSQDAIENVAVPIICKKLYDHITKVYNNYKNQFQWYCEEIVKVIESYNVNFNNPVFKKSNYGKLIGLTLIYIKDRIQSDYFTESFSEFYRDMQKRILLVNIDKLLLDTNDRKVTLWGAGVRGKRYIEFLEEAGLDFTVTDMNEGFHGKDIGQFHKIVNWDDLKDECDIVFVTPIGALDDVMKKVEKENRAIEVYDIQNYLDQSGLVSDNNNTAEKNKKLVAEYNKNSSIYGLYTGDNREKKIIISLTTYPKRISYAIYVIDMMLRQTMKPDKVVLVLSKEEFGGTTLSDDYINLEQRGLTILYVDDNMRSFKKYINVIQNYPDDIVITVDDDMVYSERLIEILYNSYLKHPESVSAIRTHKIQYDATGELLPYNKWMFDFCTMHEPSFALMAIGCGGVLYPPGCLHTDAFANDKIKQLCLDADDIWLKIMELRNGIKVCCAGDGSKIISITGSQESALWRENLYNGRNDSIIKKCMEFYGIKSLTNCYID